jgi:hypothetical protein
MAFLRPAERTHASGKNATSLKIGSVVIPYGLPILLEERKWTSPSLPCPMECPLLDVADSTVALNKTRDEHLNAHLSQDTGHP